jgi:hypothetical protein
MGRGWVPTNYKSKSASKDRDDKVFIYRKKSGKKKTPNTIQGFRGLVNIKKDK